MMQSTEGWKKEATSVLSRKPNCKSSKRVAITNKKTAPWQFQLPIANTDRRIIISRGTKLDELGLFVVSESEFCTTVKAVDDMIKVVDKTGFSKEIYPKYMLITLRMKKFV